LTLDEALHIVGVTLSDITRVDGGIGRNFLFEIDRGLRHLIRFQRLTAQVAQHAFENDRQTLSARIDNSGLFEHRQQVGVFATASLAAATMRSRMKSKSSSSRRPTRQHRLRRVTR